MGHLELSTEGYLELAALNPEGRSAALRRALERVVRAAPVAGAALIRPRVDDLGAWLVEYVGPSTTEMLRWISARLDASFEVMAQALKEKPPHLQRPPHLYDTSPLLFPLHPRVPIPGAIWVLWSAREQPAPLPSEELEGYRKGLEALLEVEYKEQLYFHRADEPLEPELREAITNGDVQALPAYLNLTRMTVGMDIALWGDVANGAVKVEWHSGTTKAGFGFEVPAGEGIGGRAFARQEVLHVPDYLNCPYRVPSVSVVVDEQDVRTALAVPLRSRTPDAGAILYGAKRRVYPFSAAQRVLLFRLAQSVQSVANRPPVSQFYFPSEYTYHAGERSELRRILSCSIRVQDVESWVERFVKGPAIVTAADERPFVPGNADRFEQLRHSMVAGSKAPQQTLALASRGESERGHLHIWPSLPLPPAGWPDFLEDVIAACNVLLDRVERTNDRLHRIHSRWLEEVVEGTTPQLRREGSRLGFPVDRGEVWALAWNREPVEKAKSRPLKQPVQDVALDQLDVPLILMDDVGVFLLGGPVDNDPSAVRDSLLRAFEPTPLWLVHGAAYDSFEGLRGSLLQAVTVARRLRQENDAQYVSDVRKKGLHGLLANPELSEHLTSFADGLLEPLLQYDSEQDSYLTETLALMLTKGSGKEVARQLHIHPKTVRYRIRRAEEILGKRLDSPTDRTELSMAAFVWMSRQQP